jgi:hypothetical protein
VSSAAADLLLEARDDLFRMLSADEAEILLEHADSVRQQTRYIFPVPGSRVTVQDTAITCPISIQGREHAALIPEAYYWEFHLRTLASVAEERRVGPGSYAADLLFALRQQHLPIPERDVIALLTTAVETIPKADAARAKYTDSRLAERGVATIVRAARLRLLRTVPRESWIAIQRDAARARAGTTFDFPTTY